MTTVNSNKIQALRENYNQYINSCSDDTTLADYYVRKACNDPTFFSWLFDDDSLNDVMDLSEEQDEALRSLWADFMKEEIQHKDIVVTVYRRGNIASHIAVRADKSREAAVAYIEEHTAGFNHPEDSSVELEVVDLSKGYYYSKEYGRVLDIDMEKQGLAEDYFEVDERDSKDLGLKPGCYWVMNNQYVYNDNFFEEDLSTLFFGFPDF